MDKPKLKTTRLELRIIKILCDKVLSVYFYSSKVIWLQKKFHMKSL